MSHQDHQAHQATSAILKPVGALGVLGGSMNGSGRTESDIPMPRCAISFEALEPRRLLHAGDLDLSFGTSGIAEHDLGNAHLGLSSNHASADGGAIITYSVEDQATLFRVMPSGALDPNFGQGGQLP